MPFWKFLDISYIQSSQQLQSTLTTGFERHLSVEDLYRHGWTYVFVFLG